MKMMTDTSPEGMRRAIEQNFWETWLTVCTSPRVELTESEQLVRFASGLPAAPFNAVMRSRLDDRSVEEAIGQSQAYFAAKQLPWTWYLEESATPSDLPERLRTHGLVEEAREPGMALDLALLRGPEDGPKGLVIERVTGDAIAGEYAAVMGAGFGMPEAISRPFAEIIVEASPGPDVRISGYLGRIEGIAVSTAMLIGAGGVAGIYNVATLPEYRGRGIGAALTVAPLLEARELGYRIGALQASQMGYGVYERLGFLEYCRFRQFVWKPGGPEVRGER